MSLKTLVWLGAFLGSSVGGVIPTLLGQDIFSSWALVGTLLGGIAGIWLGYRLGRGL